MEVIWISIAFVFGLLLRQLGLPTLVGYLFAGFALNAYGITGGDVLAHIAHMGVLLLLFSVGLKLRLNSLVRPEVLGAGLLHIVFFLGLVGVVFAGAGGYTWPMAATLGLALAFSSTVVAAKVLESKCELRAFHGRAAIGILVLQDLVAVGFLAAAGGHAPSPWALALFGLPLLKPLLHRVMYLSGHGELLLLFGLVLALALGGAGFSALGLSAELGALVIGVLLADHPRASELSNQVWGLKEMLLIGFFLQIGMTGVPNLEQIGVALLLCLVLPVKAALFFFLLIQFKLRARTAFLTALSLATYSEFGLIVAAMAVQQNWLGADWMLIIALACVISFTIAAPLNRYAHGIYQRLERFLDRFEHAQRHPDDEPVHLGHSQLLIMGMGRVGTGAYDFLARRKTRVIGMDADLGKVEKHRRAGRRVVYGDGEDPGLWHNLSLAGINAVLLALPNVEANHIAVRQLRASGFQGLITAAVRFPEDIARIKRGGADLAYDVYSQAGVGFAEHLWEALVHAPGAEGGGVDVSSPQTAEREAQ